MKHFYSIAIILAIVMVISCQKEVIPEVTEIDVEEVENSPMTFNSLDEMLRHIEHTIVLHLLLNQWFHNSSLMQKQ